MNRPNSPRIAAYVGLVVGLMMALAANLAATWSQGAVMIGTGVVAPIVLPLVLWLKSTFQAVTFRERIVRELAFTAVAVPAATLSYWHTWTLMSANVPPWIAAVLPLSADGVATMATLALHRSRAATAGVVREPEPKPVVSRPVAAQQNTPTAAPAAASARPLRPPAASSVSAPSAIESKRDEMVDRVAWLLAREPERAKDEVAALRAKFGVSESTAKRTRREAGRVAA